MDFKVLSDGILPTSPIDEDIETTQNSDINRRLAVNRRLYINHSFENKTENKTENRNNFIDDLKDDDTDDNLEYADNNIEDEPGISMFINIMNNRNIIQNQQPINQQPINQQPINQQPINQQTINEASSDILPRGRPLLVRSTATYNLYDNINSLRNAPPLTLPSDTNEYGVNGIPCPDNGETIEAAPILLQCSICYVNQIQTVNFPCMHACFCLSCVRPAIRNSDICPICRTQFMHVSMIYLNYQDCEPANKKRKINN
jgi:hypothetical protein